MDPTVAVTGARREGSAVSSEAALPPPNAPRPPTARASRTPAPADTLDRSAAGPERAPSTPPAPTPPAPRRRGSPAPSGASRRLDAAVRDVHSLLDESGYLADVRHTDLRQITGVLRDLGPAETRAVFDRLSVDELDTWAREMNSGAPLDFGGLDPAEKRELLASLGQRLSGRQLARLAASLRADDVVALGDAVGRLGSVETKLELVRALAPATTSGPSAHGDVRFPYSTTTDEDPEAAAVAAVLAGLAGEGAAFAQAFDALDHEQVAAVMKGTVRVSLTTMLGDPGRSVLDLDPTRLVAVLDAASGCPQPGLQARLFLAASEQLHRISAAGGPLVSHPGRGEAITRVTDAMTRALRSDTNGIVRELESELDPRGRQLVPFLTEMVKQHRSKEIGEIIVDLQRGNRRTGDPIARFARMERGNGKEWYHRNAQTLGYFVGGVQAAIAEAAPDPTSAAATLRSTFSLVGTAGLLARAVRVITVVGTTVSAVVVEEVCREMLEGNGKLGDALGELASPRGRDGKRYQGPATAAYDAAVSRVVLAARQPPPR